MNLFRVTKTAVLEIAPFYPAHEICVNPWPFNWLKGVSKFTPKTCTDPFYPSQEHYIELCPINRL